MWPVLGGVKWIRHFHGVVATPIGPGELCGGYVLWVAIRSVFGSAAFLPTVVTAQDAELSGWDKDFSTFLATAMANKYR